MVAILKMSLAKSSLLDKCVPLNNFSFLLAFFLSFSLSIGLSHSFFLSFFLSSYLLSDKDNDIYVLSSCILFKIFS